MFMRVGACIRTHVGIKTALKRRPYSRSLSEVRSHAHGSVGEGRFWSESKAFLYDCYVADTVLRALETAVD